MFITGLSTFSDRTQSVVLLGKLFKEQNDHTEVRGQALDQSGMQFTPQILRR